MAEKTKPTTIDDYIATFPEDVQGRLQLIRLKIRALAPDATETISYGIPTFKLNKSPLVYFAGWKDHISLYVNAVEDGRYLVQAYADRLGKAKVGSANVAFKRLADLDRDVLREMVRRAASLAEGDLRGRGRT